MLNRLTLVIHLLGFLTGILTGIGCSVFMISKADGFWLSMFIGSLMFVIPWGLGCLVRFILVGKINLLPWK